MKIQQKNTPPRLTILIPIFNVEKYLRECLDSVAAQTLIDIEIILLNDGSTDGSRKICEEYCARDSRFRLVNKENSGYGDSMNRGLATARGEYVGIVESDDFVDADFFAEMYRLASDSDADVAKSNFYYFYEKLDESSPRWNEKLHAVTSAETGEIVRAHNVKCALVNPNEVGRVVDPREERYILFQKPAIWSAIYRRDFLERNSISFLPSPGASYQDTGFSFKVWSTARRAVFTERAWLHYRQDNEKSSVASPGKVFCVRDEYDDIEKFLTKNDLLYDYEEDMFFARWGGYKWNFERLAAPLDHEFLLAMSKQFRADDKRAIINWNADQNVLREVREIIDDPEMYYKRKLARNAAKVSVIVPIYNVEKYLSECLDALSNQTLKDIEIILVDDGSTDVSRAIAEQYFKGDARFQLLSQPNGGLSRARNFGMSKAVAPLIMFCDSDDIYDNAMCEKMVNDIVKSGADFAACGTDIFYDHAEKLRGKREFVDKKYYDVHFNGLVNLSEKVIARTDVSVWNKIWRRGKIIEHKIFFPDGLRYEDAVFYNLYAMLSKKAFFLSESLYKYRRRDGSIMAKTFAGDPKAIDHLRVLFIILDFARDHGLFAENRELLVHRAHEYIRLSLGNTPHYLHGKIYRMICDFAYSHKKFFDSIDCTIYPTLLSYVPEPDRPPLSIGRRAYIKKLLRKPERLLSLVSPTYRRQKQTIHILDSQQEQLRNIENRISELEHKLKASK